MVSATQGRPFPLWQSLAAAVGAMAAAFVGAIAVGIPTVMALGVPKNPGDVGANVIEAGFYLAGAAALIPLLERLSRRSLRSLGVAPLGVRGWQLVAAALLLVLALQFAYQLVLDAFHQQNHVQAGFQHFGVHSPLAVTMVLVTGAVIAPIVEELFFRGLLFNAFAVRMPVYAAALLSGILFGLAHGDPVLFPALAAFGFIQAIVYRIGGNLVVPMIVHAANNALFLSLMMAVPGFH